MGAIAMTEEVLIREAERQLARARKLHERAFETVDDGLKKAYRRTMLHYMEKAVALEKVAPDYIKRLRDECLARMRFLERKMELMEKVWHEGLYDQFVEVLKEYELAYDQADALGWDPPRSPIPQVKAVSV
jgi:isocitrate dehydrogenase kinase/phosphatase